MPEKALVKQVFTEEFRVVSVAQPDNGIHVVSAEVGKSVRGLQFEIQLRTPFDETAHARCQPASRERRQQADYQPAFTIIRTQGFAGRRNTRQRRPHLLRITLAGRG